MVGVDDGIGSCLTFDGQGSGNRVDGEQLALEHFTMSGRNLNHSF